MAASEAGCLCLHFHRKRNRKAKRRTTPPATPPAMAPVLNLWGDAGRDARGDGAGREFEEEVEGNVDTLDDGADVGGVDVIAKFGLTEREKKMSISCGSQKNQSHLAVIVGNELVGKATVGLTTDKPRSWRLDVRNDSLAKAKV